MGQVFLFEGNHPETPIFSADGLETAMALEPEDRSLAGYIGLVRQMLVDGPHLTSFEPEKLRPAALLDRDASNLSS